jgi:hypothetical protein
MQKNWFEFIKRNNARIIAGFRDIQPCYYQNDRENKANPQNKQDKKAEESKTTIDGESCLLLYLAFTEYNSPLSALQKKLGWGGEKFQRIYTGLINKSLVHDISMNFSGKKGGLAKYLVLTAKGFKVINLDNYIPKSRGGTDTVHTWLQKIIADEFKARNYRVAFEVNNGDTTIDVIASDMVKKYAIEVVCSTEKTEPEKYIKVDHSGDFGKIIFACMSKNQSESIKKHMEGIAGRTKWESVIISEIFQGHILEEAEDG